MNELPLFDANCFLGHWGGAQPGAPVDAAGLLAQMDRLGLAEALVYHAGAEHYEAAYGNGLLLGNLAASPRLHGCWVVLPHYAGDLPHPDVMVVRMLAAGVRAARLIPAHSGPLRSWLYGELAVALARHKVPLLLDLQLQHWGGNLRAIDWDGLDWLLSTHPDLPVILPRVSMGADRALLPFLERHANLYLETSYYLGAGGLERLAARVGAERLIFGTGLPLYDPGLAITLLTYSGLSQAEKHLVAGDNLRRMLAVAG